MTAVITGIFSGSNGQGLERGTVMADTLVFTPSTHAKMQAEVLEVGL
jgi:hypothetical protein